MTPERTLVCVLGQTRAHELTWNSFKKNVLDELDADLALSIHLGSNYDYSNPFWQHAKYRWVAPDYEDWADAFDHAQQVDYKEPYPDWRQICKVGSHWLGGIKASGQPYMCAALIYFRWMLRHRLSLEGLTNRYDRIIITRSDFIWTCPHPLLSVLSPNKIWFLDGEYHAGLPDRHMVFSRRDMYDVLGLIDDMLVRPDDLIRRFGGYSDFNIERYQLFHFQAKDLWGRVSMFPYVAYTVRGEKDNHTDRVPGRWDLEPGMCVKSETEYRHAKNWESRIKTKADWEHLALERSELFTQREIRFGS